MKSDALLWLLLGGVALWAVSRKSTAAYGFQDPSLAAAFDADLLGSVGPRNVAIANRSTQPPFQGGTRSPSTIEGQVEQSAVGNPFAGVPFFF